MTIDTIIIKKAGLETKEQNKVDKEWEVRIYKKRINYDNDDPIEVNVVFKDTHELFSEDFRLDLITDCL